MLHLAAFSGMQAENMTKGHGWRFLEIGRRLERGVCGLSMLEVASANNAMLEPLIEICDSVMTYRRRYFSRPQWDGVVELLFCDRGNPRSVAYQVEVLRREADHLPGDRAAALFPKIAARVEELEVRFKDPAHPGVVELQELAEKIKGLSDLLTQHYFSHSVRRVY